MNLCKDFPCTCGHKRKEHKDNLSINFFGCVNENCFTCGGFEPDNLKYLEMKSEAERIMYE